MILFNIDVNICTCQGRKHFLQTVSYTQVLETNVWQSLFPSAVHLLTSGIVWLTIILVLSVVDSGMLALT